MEEKKVNNIKVNPPPLDVLISGMLNKTSGGMFEDSYPNVFIIGRKESGKTNIILNILDKLCGDKTIIIVFCKTVDVSDMWKHIQTKYGKGGLNRLVKHTSIVETDPTTKKKINNLDALMSHLKKKKRTEEDTDYIVVFDDISGELRGGSVGEFIKQNRHYKATTVVSSQGALDMKPDAIANVNHCIMLEGIPDTSIDHLKQKFGLLTDVKDLQKMYKTATEKQYDFLNVDVGREKFRKNFDTEITPEHKYIRIKDNNNNNADSDSSSDSD